MKYIKISLHGGGSYVVLPAELSDAIRTEVADLQIGDEITLDFELVELDEEEYSNLMEFAGH